MVDPVWLLKALSISIGVALLCGYISFCLLFYQGQWQLVLHPTRDVVQSAFGIGAQDGTAPQVVHFGPDASGTPQLQGWWFPAAPSGRYSYLTVLYLASGDGQVATASALLSRVHTLGLNLFAFDYRGFGGSAPTHPSQARMTEDAATALTYLASSRGVPPQQIILYGAGVGASLAVTLATANPAISAIVLDSPEPDLRTAALADPRARILPVRLLFKERFALFPSLASLHTPKLILIRTGGGRIASAAAEPRTAVNLTDSPDNTFSLSLSRFLDQYAPRPPASKP